MSIPDRDRKLNHPDHRFASTQTVIVSRQLLSVPQDLSLTNLVLIAVYWPNPHAFRPERFLEDYEKDAFVPFSAGARGTFINGSHIPIPVARLTSA